MKYYYIICRISHTIIIKADSIEEVQEVVNKDCQPIDEPQIVCYLDVPETVTIESLEQRMKGEVAQYKKAAKSLIEKGYYRRGRNYQEGSKEDLYLLKSDGRVDCIAYNCTHHRTQRVISAFLTNKLADVPSYVLTNYVTNGYNTRRGLFANYETKRERMERISRSHADYMGNEVSSSIDHQQRVSMRN